VAGAEKGAMDRNKKFAIVNRLEREIAGVVKKRNSTVAELQPSFDDLTRNLDTSPQATTLSGIKDQLWSIDDRLAHIQENTPPLVRTDYFFKAIKDNTGATAAIARANRRSVLLISLLAIFWSAFYSWKNYDDLGAFFQATTSVARVFFQASTNFILHLFS
jgi:hypothetical protein